MLADSAYIDSLGHVFACCHARPFRLGNIYGETLRDVWERSAPLKLSRYLSAHRRLYCAYACSILSEEQKRTPVGFERAHPSKLWLLMSEFCNVSCIMCEQDHRSRTTLDARALKTNIDWEAVREVEFQGGEVLAIPAAREFYLWVTRERRIEGNLITNGLLIDDAWARALVAGARWVAVSVNAATKATHETINRNSSFERVMRNIDRLVSAKRASGSAVHVVFKFTIVPENTHEMADAIAIAEAAGCDWIAYGYSSAAAQLLRGDHSLRAKIREDISRARDAHQKISVQDGGLRQLGVVG